MSKYISFDAEKMRDSDVFAQISLSQSMIRGCKTVIIESSLK